MARWPPEVQGAQGPACCLSLIPAPAAARLSRTGLPPAVLGEKRIQPCQRTSPGTAFPHPRLGSRDSRAGRADLPFPGRPLS